MPTSPTFSTWFSTALAGWVSLSPDERSQASFGRIVGLDPAAVSRLRSGDQLPTLPQLSAIVRALGCTRDDARTAYELRGVDLGPVTADAADTLGSEEPPAAA